MFILGIQNNVANTAKTDYKLIDNTKNTFGNDGLSVWQQI